MQQWNAHVSEMSGSGGVWWVRFIQLPPALYSAILKLKMDWEKNKKSPVFLVAVMWQEQQKPTELTEPSHSEVPRGPFYPSLQSWASSRRVLDSFIGIRPPHMWVMPYKHRTPEIHGGFLIWSLRLWFIAVFNISSWDQLWAFQGMDAL